jgi:hypothetical protein
MGFLFSCLICYWIWSLYNLIVESSLSSIQYYFITSMEKFAVLRKITYVTQSPYLLPGVMAASHCFPWERWNSWGLDCIHSWHVFMVCLFGMDGIFWVNVHFLLDFLSAITFILSFARRMFQCQVLRKSISALKHLEVFSLLSVIGCRN